MRKSMLILLLAWWLVAPAWGAELPREVRDALPAAAEEITEDLDETDRGAGGFGSTGR